MYRAVIEDLSPIWRPHRPRLGGEPALVCLQGSAEGAADGIAVTLFPTKKTNIVKLFQGKR